MIEDFFALHLFAASTRKACLAILLAIYMSSIRTVRSWEIEQLFTRAERLFWHRQ
jgi:hypothetical protein